MANPEHVEIVKAGKVSINEFLKSSSRREPLDLTGENLEGIDLSSLNLTGVHLKSTNLTNANLSASNLSQADLTEVIIKNANLSGCTFANSKFVNVEAESAIFEKANFNATNIVGGNFYKAIFDRCIHLKFNAVANINFKEASFKDIILSGSKFTNCDFSGANFKRATLVRTEFEKCDLSRVNLYETEINLTVFNDVSGITTIKNADLSIIVEHEKYFSTCKRPFSEEYIGWDTIRTFGKLPLFGASYSALIAIPTYLYFLDIYNTNIIGINVWLEQYLNNGGAITAEQLKDIVVHIKPLQVPSQFLMLLISTVLLALGSTLYTFYCPSRVKEFTQDQWVDQIKGSLLHYLPLAWKSQSIRLITAFCYAVGGTGALIVLGNKVFNAAMMIIRNG